MGYTKDLWTRPVPGTGRREHSDRWGKGKRWLACWTDPEGNEKSRAFRTQAAANSHWKAMEADKERGHYHDPGAGKALFGVFGKRWLDSRVVDPPTTLRYETSYRLHVSPVFAHRQVRSIKPSEIQAWIKDLSERFGPSTVIAAFLVLQGILDLAVADDAIRRSRAKSPVVQVPGHQASDIQVWEDAIIAAVIAAHPDQLRAILALEDFGLDERIVRVRRQIKKIGCAFVFPLPKNDRERIVPLSDWDVEIIRRHIAKYPPRPYSLPWERPGGKPRTCNLLFRRASDDRFSHLMNDPRNRERSHGTGTEQA